MRVLLCTLATLALARAPVAQVALGPVQERHARAVYAERLDAVLLAWDAADPIHRAACEGLFAAARGPSGPRDAWPDLASLSAGLRTLRGADPATCGSGSLAALADSLDLQVVPGTFEPSGEGERGEPLTVRVYPVAVRAAGLAARDVELELRWVWPDGAETVARRESVSRNAFQPAGFDVYVRAPVAVDGAVVDLVCILREVDGGEARGVPVPVACVAGFRGEFLAAHAEFGARAEGAYDTGLGLTLDELRDLYVSGCRTTRGDSATTLLAHALARARGVAPPPVTARPLGAAQPRPLDLGPALWVREPATAPRRTVLMPAPQVLAAEGLFHGVVGAAWAAAADEAGLRLVTADLPRKGDKPISSLVADVASRWPEPLAVVARGDVIVRLLFESLGWEGADSVAFVLASSSEKIGSALSPSPTLVVGPGQEGLADGVVRVRDDAPLPMLEARLPEHVAAFLARLDGE